MSRLKIKGFWKKVDIKSHQGCWIWMGYKDKKGYGKFWFNKQTHLAHRLVYKMCVNDIPLKKCVLHSCDNPSCCNPYHLFLGTQADNVKDMYLKHREACGEKKRK